MVTDKTSTVYNYIFTISVLLCAINYLIRIHAYFYMALSGDECFLHHKMYLRHQPARHQPRIFSMQDDVDDSFAAFGQVFCSSVEIACSFSDWCVHCFITETREHAAHHFFISTVCHTLSLYSSCAPMNQWKTMREMLTCWSRSCEDWISSRDHASQLVLYTD